MTDFVASLALIICLVFVLPIVIAYAAVVYFCDWLCMSPKVKALMARIGFHTD